ncbi:MAG: sensor histidine kinase [Bacteroidetes bacterium]|nr:MAG: sensor histidine kinase [Bacteroidota bacterium]
MSSSRHSVWSSLLVCLLLLAAAGCTSTPQPEAVFGLLDLREVSLDRPLPLEGTWLAYAGPDTADLAAYDLPDDDWQPARIPAYFTRQGFPDEGQVWYRLHLRLPAGQPPLAGYVQHANNAHAIYAARPGHPPVELARSGRPGATVVTTQLSRRPVRFSLPADTALVLTWRVANYDYRNGGPFHAIRIGTAPSIERMLLRQNAVAFASCGMYLLIGLAFLIFWFANRTNYAMLALSLLALAMAVRTVSTAGLLEPMFPQAIDFEARIAVEAISYLVLNGLFAFLLWAFFPREFLEIHVVDWRLHLRQPDEGRPLRTYRLVDEEPPKLPDWLRVATTIPALTAAILSLFFSLTVLIVSPQVTSYLLAISRWLSLLLIPPALIVLLAALQRRRPLARSTALGFLFVLGGGIHDVLRAMGVIEGTPYVFPQAFLGFILIQGIAVGCRFVRELREASLAAQAANRVKSQFLNTVSHEIRTPLTAIMGFNQILESELAPRIEPHEREFLQIIRTSSTRLLDLVNNLLDVASADTGQLHLTLDAVPIEVIIDDVLNQLHTWAHQKGLTLKALPAEEPTVAYADAMRLRQVLLNLVSNAIKFTSQGHVTVHTGQARLVLTTGGPPVPAVTLVVEDTGRGIAPEFMPHLFTRFAQEQRTYTEGFQGVGLGLSITRELVLSMNGEIYAESEVGVGSRFTVVLPAYTGQPIGVEPPPRRTASPHP